MTHLKTPKQITLMREAGLVVWEAHQIAADLIAPGVTTAEINAAVEQVIALHNATPLFKGVPGKVPFPAGTCISVNEEVVHGIPGKRVLQEGDIVSIDIGVRLHGWCGDAAVTHPVGKISPEKQRLLEITEGTLRLAMKKMETCRRWSEVAGAMAQYVAQAGFSVVEELTGHSIGEELWEALQVPNYTSRNFERNYDFYLQPGIVIAVEPMVNSGTRHIKTLADHWTIVTADRKPSAHFEHTLALTENGVQALTASPTGTGWALP
jgi:methionyl aminopeptidase